MTSPLAVPSIVINGTHLAATPVTGPDGEPGVLMRIGAGDVAAAHITIDAGHLDTVIETLQQVRAQSRGAEIEVVSALPDHLRNGHRRG